MSNEVTKLKRAEYYDNVMQAEMDSIALLPNIDQQEYDQKCNALINQKLYVESKVIDVIDFEKHLESRKEFLKRKIDQINDQIYGIDYWIENSKDALKDWMKDNRKVEVDEYILSLRPSKSIEIVDESLIPEMFWNEKLVRTISKTKIKEAFDNGEIVPGAIVKENKNIVIKD